MPALYLVLYLLDYGYALIYRLYPMLFLYLYHQECIYQEQYHEANTLLYANQLLFLIYSVYLGRSK